MLKFDVVFSDYPKVAANHQQKDGNGKYQTIATGLTIYLDGDSGTQDLAILPGETYTGWSSQSQTSSIKQGDKLIISSEAYEVISVLYEKGVDIEPYFEFKLQKRV